MMNQQVVKIAVCLDGYPAEIEYACLLHSQTANPVVLTLVRLRKAAVGLVSSFFGQCFFFFFFLSHKINVFQLTPGNVVEQCGRAEWLMK